MFASCRMAQANGSLSSLSMTYSAVAKPICLRLFLHCVETACDLALAKAGNNIAARMAMMAMTTSNSIRVNPGEREVDLDEDFNVIDCYSGKTMMSSIYQPP